MTRQQRITFAHVLPHVDNPMNEDRWGDARAIADRLGWPRRGMTGTLDAMRRAGLVEAQGQGDAPSGWSDAPPRLWRTVATAMTKDQSGEPS